MKKLNALAFLFVAFATGATAGSKPQAPVVAVAVVTTKAEAFVTPESKERESVAEKIRQRIREGKVKGAKLVDQAEAALVVTVLGTGMEDSKEKYAKLQDSRGRTAASAVKARVVHTKFAVGTTEAQMDVEVPEATSEQLFNKPSPEKAVGERIEQFIRDNAALFGKK